MKKKMESPSLFDLALTYLINTGRIKTLEDYDFDLILQYAIKARKRLDSHPALYRAYMGTTPLSKRMRCYYRKIGLL